MQWTRASGRLAGNEVRAFRPTLAARGWCVFVHHRAAPFFAKSHQGKVPNPCKGPSTLNQLVNGLSMKLINKSILGSRQALCLVVALVGVPTGQQTRAAQPAVAVVACGTQEIPYVSPGTRFTSIAGGHFHNLALKSDGM